MCNGADAPPVLFLHKQQRGLTTKPPNEGRKVSARINFVLQQEDCEYEIISQLNGTVLLVISNWEIRKTPDFVQKIKVLI